MILSELSKSNTMYVIVVMVLTTNAVVSTLLNLASKNSYYFLSLKKQAKQSIDPID